MSAGSVTAYLSPTMLRNFAISSAESEGSGLVGGVMFIFLIPDIRSFPPDGRAAQPVIDGFTQSMIRNGHHRNRPRRLGIERAKIAEKIGGGFPEIAALR